MASARVDGPVRRNGIVNRRESGGASLWSAGSGRNTLSQELCPGLALPYSLSYSWSESSVAQPEFLAWGSWLGFVS